jgi:hypothetical protein
MKDYNRILILNGACLLAGSALWAQAPPGPMAAPPPSVTASIPGPPKKVEVPARKDIFGAWRFNKDESDDPRTRQSQDSGRSGGGGGYGGPRIGFPGGGPGGGGNGPYGGSRRPEDDSSQRLGDLVNPVRELQMLQRNPNDPEVEMYDDRSHRHLFYTDGRKIDKQKDPSLEEISARWDGSRLVTDEKAPKNGKMTRTFELSQDGRQLTESIRVTDSKGNHPINVSYVYDAIEKSELSFPPH